MIEGAAHLANVERPRRVQRGAPRAPGAVSDDAYERGMEVRREVLGDEHVDRGDRARRRDHAEFQDLITRYAWGEIWARPGSIGARAARSRSQRS